MQVRLYGNQSATVVGWDPIACLPITAADVYYTLGCIAYLLGQPSVAWDHPVLECRRAELVRMLEE